MISPQPEMLRRAELTQKTLDRFKGKPITMGKVDCVRMAAYHLRQFGYRPRLTAGGVYNSPRSALAALRRAGFASLPEAVDAMLFERIAPAAAIVGDVVFGEADTALGALGILLGNRAMLGFHDGIAKTLRWSDLQIAWRVPPR